MTPGQQIGIAACNEITNTAQKNFCLSKTDPNVFCMEAFSSSGDRTKCLDYAADPCGKLLDDPTAQAMCRAGVEQILSNSISVEQIVRLNIVMGARLACTSQAGPIAGEVCAIVAGAIYDAIADALGSDPPTDDQFALMILQLSRGTYQPSYAFYPGHGATWSLLRAYELKKLSTQTAIANVKLNLTALGLRKVWNLPGGAAQSRDLVKIVLSARNHLHHRPQWWIVKRSAAELK